MVLVLQVIIDPFADDPTSPVRKVQPPDTVWAISQKHTGRKAWRVVELGRPALPGGTAPAPQAHGDARVHPEAGDTRCS